MSVRYDAIEMTAMIIIVNKTPECNILLIRYSLK